MFAAAGWGDVFFVMRDGWGCFPSDLKSYPPPHPPLLPLSNRWGLVPITFTFPGQMLSCNEALWDFHTMTFLMSMISWLGLTHRRLNSCRSSSFHTESNFRFALHTDFFLYQMFFFFYRALRLEHLPLHRLAAGQHSINCCFRICCRWSFPNKTAALSVET